MQTSNDMVMVVLICQKETLTSATTVASNSFIDFFALESTGNHVRKSEVVGTEFLVEHNLPMAVADSLEPKESLFQVDNSKSSIIMATKTSCVINDALVPYL